jgi:hypothetical protein
MTESSGSTLAIDAGRLRDLRQAALDLLDEAVRGSSDGTARTVDAIHRLQRVNNDLAAIGLARGVAAGERKPLEAVP